MRQKVRWKPLPALVAVCAMASLALVAGLIKWSVGLENIPAGATVSFWGANADQTGATRRCQAQSNATATATETSPFWTLLDDGHIRVHSVFLDQRVKEQDRRLPYLRVLVMDFELPQLFCTFASDKGDVSVAASAQEIWLSAWNKNYSPSMYRAYILSCPVPDNVSLERVGLSRLACPSPPMSVVWMDVISRDAEEFIARAEQPEASFCVCVKPLLFPNDDEDISKDLIEWIELNKLFGAQKIVFYVFAVNRRIQRVLDAYQRSGLVQVISWQLPDPLPGDVYRLQTLFKTNPWLKRRTEVVPYNHCLYSNMYSFRFVLPVDVDEIIVPLGQLTNWTQVIDETLRSNPPWETSVGSFSVQNAYFFRAWSDGGVRSATGFPPLNIERFTWRSGTLSPPGHAVKSFVNTRVAASIFNHYALTTVLPWQKRNIHVKANLAQMNHYKSDCSNLERECSAELTRNKISDDSARRFSPYVADKVNVMFKSIFHG